MKEREDARHAEPDTRLWLSCQNGNFRGAATRNQMACDLTLQREQIEIIQPLFECLQYIFMVSSSGAAACLFNHSCTSEGRTSAWRD